MRRLIRIALLVSLLVEVGLMVWIGHAALWAFVWAQWWPLLLVGQGFALGMAWYWWPRGRPVLHSEREVLRAIHRPCRCEQEREQAAQLGLAQAVYAYEKTRRR